MVEHPDVQHSRPNLDFRGKPAVAKANRRSSECRAELVRAMLSEEEEDEVNLFELC